MRRPLTFVELGRKLFEALPSVTKRFVELEGAGHNDIPYHDPSRYLREVSAFLREARESFTSTRSFGTSSCVDA